MKYFWLVLPLFLIGCASTTPPLMEIVYVDRPIFASPLPPELPVFDSMVDKLTPDDYTNPGKVGQAYKHDMLILRAINSQCRETFIEYAALPRPDDVVTDIKKTPVEQ